MSKLLLHQLKYAMIILERAGYTVELNKDGTSYKLFTPEDLLQESTLYQMEYSGTHRFYQELQEDGILLAAKDIKDHEASDLTVENLLATGFKDIHWNERMPDGGFHEYYLGYRGENDFNHRIGVVVNWLVTTPVIVKLFIGERSVTLTHITRLGELLQLHALLKGNDVK